MAEIISFKDLKVKSGTKLYEALAAKDFKLAEKLYWEMETEFRKYFPSGKIITTESTDFPSGSQKVNNDNKDHQEVYDEGLSNSSGTR